MWSYISILSRHSLDGIATGYELEVGVQFPAGTIDVSLFHSVQTGFGVHPASHSMDIRCSLRGGKTGGA
jgi:hypothetical protein